MTKIQHKGAEKIYFRQKFIIKILRHNFDPKIVTKIIENIGAIFHRYSADWLTQRIPLRVVSKNVHVIMLLTHDEGIQRPSMEPMEAPLRPDMGREAALVLVKIKVVIVDNNITEEITRN